METTTRETQLDALNRLFELLQIEPRPVTLATTMFQIGADDDGAFAGCRRSWTWRWLPATACCTSHGC